MPKVLQIVLFLNFILKKAIFLPVCLLILMGCKTLAYKKYAKDLSISFGNGGGFTGARNEFILTGTGILKSIKPFTTDTTNRDTLSKKEYKAIFNQLESKPLKDLTQDKPGNMTCFITFYKKGELIKNFQWEQGAAIPKELQALYDQLIKLNKQ